MKAISLWQPWASLIAIGAKPYETRHWHPGGVIRQRIAIHAAKRSPRLEEIEMWLKAAGNLTDKRLPLGAIVCTAYLSAAYQVKGHTQDGDPILESLGAIKDDGFGDYGLDRYCWYLTDVERVDPPVPYRGAQGWFDLSEGLLTS